MGGKTCLGRTNVQNNEQREKKSSNMDIYNIDQRGEQLYKDIHTHRYKKKTREKEKERERSESTTECARESSEDLN